MRPNTDKINNLSLLICMIKEINFNWKDIIDIEKPFRANPCKMVWYLFIIVKL